MFLPFCSTLLLSLYLVVLYFFLNVVKNDDNFLCLLEEKVEENIVNLLVVRLVSNSRFGASRSFSAWVVYVCMCVCVSSLFECELQQYYKYV